MLHLTLFQFKFQYLSTWACHNTMRRPQFCNMPWVFHSSVMFLAKLWFLFHLLWSFANLSIRDCLLFKWNGFVFTWLTEYHKFFTLIFFSVLLNIVWCAARNISASLRFQHYHKWLFNVVRFSSYLLFPNCSFFGK